MTASLHLVLVLYFCTVESIKRSLKMWKDFNMEAKNSFGKKIMSELISIPVNHITYVARFQHPKPFFQNTLNKQAI